MTNGQRYEQFTQGEEIHPSTVNRCETCQAPLITSSSGFCCLIWPEPFYLLSCLCINALSSTLQTNDSDREYQLPCPTSWPHLIGLGVSNYPRQSPKTPSLGMWSWQMCSYHLYKVWESWWPSVLLCQGSLVDKMKQMHTEKQRPGTEGGNKHPAVLVPLLPAKGFSNLKPRVPSGTMVKNKCS